MNEFKNALYTAKVRTTGGRDGASRSDDGRLDIKHSVPGGPGKGSNPEQLFAAGWSACFEGAMQVAARQRKVMLPDDTAIDAEIDLHSGDTGYFISARLNITIPGVAKDVAQQIVNDAIGICPYSKATHGNVETAYNLM